MTNSRNGEVEVTKDIWRRIVRLVCFRHVGRERTQRASQIGCGSSQAVVGSEFNNRSSFNRYVWGAWNGLITPGTSEFECHACNN